MMGKHRTTSENQTNEVYPSVATRRWNPMKLRFTKIILNVILAGFDAADGDPPRAKKAEGQNCFAIFGLSDGKR